MNEETTADQNSCLHFSQVTLADKPVVDHYMKTFGQCSCQHSFAALFTMTEKYGSKICIEDGFLFTLREGLCSQGKRVYLAPMGEGDQKGAYARILADAAVHQCKAVFQTVTGEQVDFLRKNFPGRFQYTELRDYAEYIYSTEKLAGLEGRKFAVKRKEIRKFCKEYGERLQVRELSSKNVEEVWKFEQDWMGENCSTHDKAALQQEARAIQIQLDHFDVLDLRGIAAYIDSQMVGFCYGVPLNDICFDGVIEKAKREYKHVYKFLNWKMSCICAAEFTCFNWEEDVGVAGLRNFKMLYEPAVLLRKYLVEEPEKSAGPTDAAKIRMVSSTEIYPGEELVAGSFPG